MKCNKCGAPLYKDKSFISETLYCELCGSYFKGDGTPHRREPTEAERNRPGDVPVLRGSTNKAKSRAAYMKRYRERKKLDFVT